MKGDLNCKKEEKGGLTLTNLFLAVWWFLRKLRIELPYDPAIPLLGYLPQKLTDIYSQRYTQHRFAAAYSQWPRRETTSVSDKVKDKGDVITYTQWNTTRL